MPAWRCFYEYEGAAKEHEPLLVNKHCHTGCSCAMGRALVSPKQVLITRGIRAVFFVWSNYRPSCAAAA